MQDKTDETDTNDSEPKVKEEMQVFVDATINGEVEEINPLEIKEEPLESGEITAHSTPSTESKANKEKEGETEQEKTPTNKLKRKRRVLRRRQAKVQRMAEPQESQTESSNSVVEEEVPEPAIMETTVKIEPQVKVQEDVEFVLTVSNMPSTWTYMDIKNYIDTEIEPVDEMELVTDEKTGKGAIRLSYQSEEQCKSSMEKLQAKEIEGNKLIVVMTVETLDSDSDTDEKPKRPWRPDMDEWEIDPKGLYGLKQEFLKSLDITPPIDKWVYVANFRCDKSELRDIMELAGKVVSVSVYTVMYKYANVLYTHPLEAVQAVSMLNNALYYGQRLKVRIERSPSETILLPKGLTTIGQGLGIKGKPLRNIVKHYKKLLANESSLLNPLVVDLPDGCVPKDTPEVHFEIKTMTTEITTEVKETKPVQTTAKQKYTKVSPNITLKPKNSLNSIPTVSIQQNQPNENNAQFRPSPPFNRGPRPVAPSPMVPGPVRPGPMEPRPMNPGPMNPGPMNSGPMNPGPMNPGPMNSGPMNPGPMNPGPYGPRPMEPRMMGQFGNGWNGPGPIRAPMQGPIRAPMQGPIRAPMQGPIRAPMHGPIRAPMQGPMPGPGQVGPRHMGPGPMMPGPMPVQNMGMMNSNEPVQLQLANLPPSTTFGILCEKMAQCGQVVAIQLTTPGCAVVTFGNRMQADHCINTYNGNYVDGHVIQVKYS